MSSLQLERKLKAHNDAADTGNPMHDDEAARAMGFSGAVVPGVTVYGYITHTFVECFGNEWLTQGYCQVRFRQPVIADEEILLRADTDMIHTAKENYANDPRPHFDTLGPKTRREFLRLQALKGEGPP